LYVRCEVAIMARSRCDRTPISVIRTIYYVDYNSQIRMQQTHVTDGTS